MKILALDVGDKHTGTAISDALGFFAKPYKTVDSALLQEFIKNILQTEEINTIVIGWPKTMRGTISDQTKKVETTKKELEIVFPTITWILWDERLTSKQAARIKKVQTKEDKLHAHSIAAALILSSYLEFAKIH